MSKLRNEINNLCKEEITNFIEEKKTEITNFWQELEITSSLVAIKKHVKTLQDQNATMKEKYRILKNELDDLKQYVRRPTLRIYGVIKERNETSDMVEEKVKNMIGGMFPNDSPNVIDRAHRVWKIKNNGDGNIFQPIIVRSRSFYVRTVVYRRRKEMYKYGISLDLTKSRLAVLNSARDLVQNVSGVKFVYCNINCYLRVLTSSGKHISFSSICDLQNIIANI